MPCNPNFCNDCQQDLIRDCAETIHVTQPCLVQTIRRFAAAAKYVGIDAPQLVDLLKAGISVGELLDIIQSRLEAEECGDGRVA